MGKTEVISLLVQGGAASGGAALGPKLGPLGINMGDVVAKINETTANMKGMDVPVKVVIDIESKTFEIEVGRPPTSALLKKEAGIDKGAGKAAEFKAGNVSIEQIIKVARIKDEDLLGGGLKNQVKEVIGTCVSAGLEVEGKAPKEIFADVDAGKYDEQINNIVTETPADKLKEIQARSRELNASAKQAIADEKAAEEAKAAKAAKA